MTKDRETTCRTALPAVQALAYSAPITKGGVGKTTLAVHIAARVGASAGPGEILVSGTVKDLVVGSGIEFIDRGDHELKGVPGSWKLFAVAN